MSKEYTYEIDKYTIGVDENGENWIDLTIAIIKSRNKIYNFLGKGVDALSEPTTTQ